MINLRNMIGVFDGSRARQSLAALLLTVGLSACGVTYTSPAVSDKNTEAPVTVVAMTSAAVADANRSAYTPRQLPTAFFQIANAGGLRNAGALPQPPDISEEIAEPLVLKPPPPVTAERYRIGVGDVVILATRDTATTIEQLSGLLAAQNRRQGYTVRDDGTITIPEIGTVKLAEMTLSEAEDELFKVLVEKGIDPSFSIEVSEFNARKVIVGGDVAKEMVVPVTLSPLLLSEALAAAGGASHMASEFAAIRIYRDGELYQIPMHRFRNDPDLQETRMVDGDAVYVDQTFDPERAIAFYERELKAVALRGSARERALAALKTEYDVTRARLEEQRRNYETRAALDAVERDFVYLAGEVREQARVALPFGRQATLADVLFDKGGFETTTGDASEIYVLRAGSGGLDAPVTAFHLNAKNITNMVIATRFQMRPNDIIFVEEQPITKWGRALQQLFPVLTGAAANAL